MRKLLLYILLILNVKTFAQCNAVQSLSPLQMSQLAPVYQASDTALYYEQLFQIDSLAAEARSILNTQAGLPESAETNYTLVSNTSWIGQTAAINLSRLLIAADSQAYADVWKLAKGMYPPAYLPHSVPLRASAEICSGLLKIAAAETDPNRQNAYRQWATRGLDSLLTMQLASGAFPFTDLRPYGDPVFTPIINNYLQSLGADSVNVLVNGWIIDDSGTGEFKFDAGVIGGAFAEAYRFTGDTNYRNAAERVADYLLPLHFNLNYNYNTFASYGMIMAWMNAPNDTAWINRAAKTARYAVLPGQLPNGHWMDGHNAKSSYHGIMIHNNAVLLAALPAGNPYRDTLALMTERSVRNFLSRMDTCGASTGFDCLLQAWWLDNTVLPVSLHDSLGDAIGRYINEANSNGRYLDVYTMGLYFQVLDSLNGFPETDFSFADAIALYPNPSNDGFKLSLDITENTILTTVIYDLQGRMITAPEKAAYTAGHYTIPVSGDQLVPGIYLLQISNGKTYRSIRLVKSNN